MTEFHGVLPKFNQTLTKRGYEKLTTVQKAVIVDELTNEDLLVSAQTGSGKTVAFGLALAPTLLDGAESFSSTATPMALVIAPTRELALQVQRELEWLYEASNAKVISCVGGMDIRAEQRALKNGPHIVVGTPGRLCDHIKRGFFDTSELKAVVLDEADEMLDMGFRDELEYILNTSPETRRTLLFSATLSRGIENIAKKYQRDAKRISTKEENNQHSDIEYQAICVGPSDKQNTIINLLRYHEANNAIIFCSTRASVNNLTSRLKNRGFSVVALSGELSQAERSHALQALRDGRAKVCVATDVASRGIDLPGLGLVIHADAPQNRDILLHRSGRTGRAGSKGISAIVVPHNWRKRIERLLENAKVKAEFIKPPSITDILKRDNERFLSNPILNDPIQDDEKSAIEELVGKFSHEQIAAALVRLNKKENPAPEEIDDSPIPESASRASEREFFTESVWVSLSCGRSMDANPRWILPMICGAGHVTKKQIGAIRITEKETFVEIEASSADKFFKTIGEGGKLEKGIIATRLAEKPQISEGGGGRRDGGRGGRKEGGRSDRRDRDRGDRNRAGKEGYKGKSGGGGRGGDRDRPKKDGDNEGRSKSRANRAFDKAKNSDAKSGKPPAKYADKKPKGANKNKKDPNNSFK